MIRGYTDVLPDKLPKSLPLRRENELTIDLLPNESLSLEEPIVGLSQSLKK